MHARVTRAKSAPEIVDQAIAWFKQTVLPRAESQPGFAGALDVDRETGSWLTVTLWETVEARDASEEMAEA